MASFQKEEMIRALGLASAGVVGFRFHPTDEELVDHYMKLKMLGYDDEVSGIITEIDICKFEPRDLPRLSPMYSENDTSWYFFCRPDYKYTKSKRLNRTTKEGSWKVTGKDRTIKSKRNKKVIGIKRTLVFHVNNKPKPSKTNWIIHEYHSKVTYPNQREIILCRLKYKHDDTTEISSSDEGEPSQQQLFYDLEDEAEDIIMGEADNPRLDEIMSQFQSLIDHPNQSPSFEISDELLRRMFDTPLPERPLVFVNSLPPEQYAASFEGSSPSESSSRGLVRSPRFADYEVNHMLKPQGGLTPDTRTNRSQYRARSKGVIELQANFGDSSYDAPSVMTLERVEPHEQGDSFRSDDEPKSKNYIAVKSPVKGELQMHSPPEVTSKYKAKEAEGQGDSDDLKGSIVLYSNRSSKMAENSSSSRSSKPKSPSPQTLGRFIVMEPSSPNLMEEPPSVYVFNLAIGIILFFVFVRELMVLH